MKSWKQKFLFKARYLPFTRKSFTLAEVLITLGIIGVVAGMTIPVLMHNIQDQQFKTAYKKTYSTLSQALERTIYDNGNITYNCYVEPNYTQHVSDCITFWNDFKQELRIIKEYTGPVDGVNAPNYTGTDLIVAQGGHNNEATCGGGNSGSKFQKVVWTLSDGSLIISYDSTFNGGSPDYFIVDTNGLRNPNKWGYDLFILNFYKTNVNVPITITDLKCGSQEKGGYNMKDILTQ